MYMRPTKLNFSIVKYHTKSLNQRSQSSGYWENKENILNFLSKIKQKYNFSTPEDWNSITIKLIKSNGGSSLFSKYSIFALKCMACPEGKSLFNSPKHSAGYWENKENIQKFLLQIKEKYNLNTPNDWNLITKKQIQENGGRTLFSTYSIYQIKCIACPEGRDIFKNSKHIAGYWENKENILNFLAKIKEKYNLKSPNDWNTVSQNQIQLNGGGTLLNMYSMVDLKCMACPEGKEIFKNPKETQEFWESQENILQFLSEIKEKYNLNTPKDWNSITKKQIQSNGGNLLLSKYSMFELKCIACPEGKEFFNKPKEPPGYWENKENIQKFLLQIKEKYNLNTPNDWNSITQNHFKFNGGSSLLSKYSMLELKCMACPDGELLFGQPHKSSGYWENEKNVQNFLLDIKQKYNLNSHDDWNSITQNHIKSNGGSGLLSKYSMFEIKCMACTDTNSILEISTFNNPKQQGYWENEENIRNFFAQLKEKYNLHTPEDWKRISKSQIISEGGWGLLNKNYLDIKINFKIPNEPLKSVPLSELISGYSVQKRSSQRWLFLQVQKLFPHEEIVEDYFHSEISRISGFNVQFDIFMIERNIAIEYHGKHHYEDMPAGFSNLETYQQRDTEKEKLCKEHGIQLIVIPYWWNNKLDSLKTYLYSKINL